ncbi:molybdopterin-containing oxidoreductase family protein [Pelotomaculum propionicicum]|uniref:Acetylene hydratase n=1 Tax=Pelotomaculum propionicicum TaxID=258475 RepID=A0A4Y7RR75_9FIRM|nr:molybdopterin-dependent oxidoreductase [Pelotomaculum propionicicum]TEB11373.1 Acetylene hydratase [Pelotomaculum propionicicum]
MVVEKKPAICGICPGGCAVEVTLEDGRLVKAEPLQGAPYANLCVRGRYAPEIVYSPHRLQTPLIRTGERGEGKFRIASWDEALDLTAQKMNEIKAKYGPQALLSHSGRGAFEQSLVEFCNSRDSVANNLLLPFGSPNIASTGSLCFVSYGILAPMANFGLPGAWLTPDLENSNLIVVWGTNPVTDSPPIFFKRIARAQRKKTRVIAVDQMRSDIAGRADQWVGVRSGTDGALILGLLNVVINEQLYNRDFVENWTLGFAELSDYVRNFTPAKVESITRVPAATVTALAREIANTEGVSLRTYTGLEYTNSGVQNIRALYILWALTGNLDVPGGLCLSAPPASPAQREKIEAPAGVLPIGADKYPLFYELTRSAHYMEFPRAVLEGKPYPVKGLLINGSSTLTSYPQPAIFEEAYRSLDFMMVIDLVMTRDALFADVVLPSATYYEINSYQRYPGYVRLRRQVIKPVGQSKNCFLIMAELANRLGYGHLYPQSEEEVIEKAFAGNPGLLEALKNSPDGVKLPYPERRYKKYELGLLRKDREPGFPTPSGKMEITSSLMAKHGYDALPVYTEPAEGPLQNPELCREFPLVMNTGARIQSTFRSQHLNVPGLVKLQEKPQALINPVDAAERGISSGDRVAVSTRRGRVFFYADVTEKVLPGQTEVNMGGGNPTQVEAWRLANVNDLADFSNRDPVSGFPVFKALLCQIEKA